VRESAGPRSGQAGLSDSAATPAPPAVSLLVVLPRSDRKEIENDTPVAGLPLLRRIALAGARAGFAAVLIARPRTTDSALLAGTGATLLWPGAPLPGACACRVVLLPAHIVPHPGSLRTLLETAIEPGRVYADRASVAMLDVKDATSVLVLAARCPDLAELRAALGAWLDTDAKSLDMHPRLTSARTGRS
jgi:hypothetical protein